MIDLEAESKHLYNHLHMLTEIIGERSVRRPANLHQTVTYIQSFYETLGIPSHLETYTYRDLDISNVVAELSFTAQPKYRYLVGAHYDSVAGTVGADDNASGVAVLLELARVLKNITAPKQLDLAVTFVAFGLEEPPAYATGYMGSRIYARKARRRKEKIDGMICLEMVGYACYESGCQNYPFPLRYFGYPEQGNFMGIVGNFKSRRFGRKLLAAFQQGGKLPAINLNVPFNGHILPQVRLSDHAPFWDNGYKAVMITDTAFFRNPYYHTASDTLEKLDYDFMAKLVQSLAAFFSSQYR